jgi:aminoglycoside 3-N-acetyltransferase
MVWGKYSGKLAGLQNISSFGSDSPFDFLLKNKARALLIGTTVAEAFTFTHFVEEQRQVKYRRYKTYRIDYAGEDGTAQKQEFVLYAKKSGWTMCLDRLENLLDEKGMIRREIYNGVGFSTIELSDAYEIISEDIRDNKARNIACFNMSLYLKDNIKRVLGKFFGYRTVSERLRG